MKWNMSGRNIVPRKILVRLSEYVNANDFGTEDQIFPISYVAAWSMLKKAGKLVDIELKPHDFRRHADLSTTQRYLGKVDDTEAIWWIETLYG